MSLIHRITAGAYWAETGRPCPRRGCKGTQHQPERVESRHPGNRASKSDRYVRLPSAVDYADADAALVQHGVQDGGQWFPMLSTSDGDYRGRGGCTGCSRCINVRDQALVECAPARHDDGNLLASGGLP